MSYTREPYRPSINERPVVRIRFTDPEGRQQQTTISTTYIQGYLAVPPFQAPGESGFAELETQREHLADLLYKFHDAMNCNIHGIESVGVSVHDF